MIKVDTCEIKVDKKKQIKKIVTLINFCNCNCQKGYKSLPNFDFKLTFSNLLNTSNTNCLFEGQQICPHESEYSEIL